MVSLTASQGLAIGFVGGAAATVIFIALAAFVFLRTSDIYGLGHWKLNIRTPLPSMWMNVGYWKKQDGGRIIHFDEAAANLLRKVVTTAGLLDQGAAACRSKRNETLAILDLGFGCGDQTWELARMVLSGGWHDFRYVGLTLNEAQVQTASRKICRQVATLDAQLEHPDESTTTAATPSSLTLRADAFHLFRANAARPETWAPRIREAVDSLSGENGRFTSRWLLALDCLYHFSPSRRPVFEYAARRLDANLMAFDLLLSDTAPARDVWAARAVGVFMGCPLRTFLTEAEYREQLVACGYDGESVTIRDITDDVFAGLVDFLDRQERALGQYGISLGGFKLAARLFRWFAESKVVRAVIVVAHTKEKST
ncbi:hypothetical protein ACRALDRAFT_1063048 [Sodiomyces alcalophilus JCM 7366]|uniref:uncharacterized protein n=1 Tax=Sodiomyces alcalophilus JCM 7366 TaxID=591952 RepID=UPI0039B38CB3